MKSFNMISGFPRSGSTLLCNMLNMNPDFHATATSPTIDLINNIKSSFSHNPGFKATDRLDTSKNMQMSMKGALEGRYFDSNVVFDKNRMWPKYLPLIDYILENEDSKIIWTYRDPVQIVRSMERQHRKTPQFAFLEESTGRDMSTLEARIDTWINGIMWHPISALQDAMNVNNSVTKDGSAYNNRILFILYSDLVNRPQATMNYIHDFLGVQKFQYNKKSFKDLKQSTNEYDTFYNHKYPHNIHEGVIHNINKTLSPDIPKYLQDRIASKFKPYTEYIYGASGIQWGAFEKKKQPVKELA